MNEIERLKIELAALRQRVAKMETSVRPLAGLQGIDADLISDQAVVSFIADLGGSTLQHVATKGGGQQIRQARTWVAQQLASKLGWTNGRIARNLNCTAEGVRKMKMRG